MKVGNIVKFHTPFPDEDPTQIYVILEVFDGENPRAKIKALNTGMNFAPVSTVNLDELIIAEIGTEDLIGSSVTILCNDGVYKDGKVVSTEKQSINLNMNKGDTGVLTNVKLKVIDQNGIEHSGYLCV